MFTCIELLIVLGFILFYYVRYFFFFCLFYACICVLCSVLCVCVYLKTRDQDQMSFLIIPHFIFFYTGSLPEPSLSRLNWFACELRYLPISASHRTYITHVCHTVAILHGCLQSKLRLSCLHHRNFIHSTISSASSLFVKKR